MLKQRVFTALGLAPLVLAAVLLMPNAYLAVVFAVVLLVGGREWAILSGLADLPGQLTYLLIICLLLTASSFFLDRGGWISWFLMLSLGWWLLILFRLSRFRGESPVSGFNLLQGIEGILVLVPAWLALVMIHGLPQDGPLFLLFLLLLIWSADIAAYFSGKRWGRVKLAPRVSPGKTREGLYGAVASSVFWGVVLAWWQGMDPLLFPLAILLSVSTALFSVIGDLFESMVKRQRGVKDSGHLLPGHGGMLDRIDSLTAAAPIFFLGLNALEQLQ